MRVLLACTYCATQKSWAKIAFFARKFSSLTLSQAKKEQHLIEQRAEQNHVMKNVKARIVFEVYNSLTFMRLNRIQILSGSLLSQPPLRFVHNLAHDWNMYLSLSYH